MMKSILVLVCALFVLISCDPEDWMEPDDGVVETPDDFPDVAPEYGEYTDEELWDPEKEKRMRRNPNRPEKIEIFTPFEDEIFHSSEVYISFKVHNMKMGGQGAGGSAIVYLNGNPISTAISNDVFLSVPGIARGVYMLLIKLVDGEGKDILVEEESHFEVVDFQPAEDISPDPKGTLGRMTNATRPPPEYSYHLFSEKIQKYISDWQNPPENKCGKRFMIWESWGIVGFGAQVLGLRVALALGLETNRIVVGNPDHEAHLVKSEMKWRFGESGQLNAPWGEGLKGISPCTRFSNVAESVRPQEWEDLLGDNVNVLVSGDIWGLRNRERLFTMPEAISDIVTKSDESPVKIAPNILWWWTEVMGYLMRPTPQLDEFISSQKKAMGWKRPIIGIHMRLGMDKNREAQRFPTSYYMHEARRIKKLFGVRTVFVCSDRKKALDKLVAKYGDEFDIIVQPKPENLLSPMYTLLTDLLLVAESDFPIFTFSSNFGQAAFFLNSFYNGHRPSYISMDDNYEGFKYYGWQLKLHRDPYTGVNELMIIDCVKDKCEHQNDAMANGDRRVIGFDYVTPSGVLVNKDEL